MTEVFYSLEDYPKQEASRPHLLTIGNFDGVHIGHVALFEQIACRAKEISGVAGVITFSNHSSTVITPQKPAKLICSSGHKRKLLESQPIELLFWLPFTSELADQTAEQFLKKLTAVLNLHTLVLGYDTAFGKNRGGNRETIQKAASSLGFELFYLKEELFKGEPISSSRIRQLIGLGDLQTAAEMMGRKFSICGKVITGSSKGRKLGFPTANLQVDSLCLPPFGVWAVTVNENQGIANLGVAPTLHKVRAPLLEVFLFDFQGDLYGREVEVVFEAFIRPEIAFSSLSTLKQQIEKDIVKAKVLLREGVNF